ncbi:IgGFc-binding protein-like [Cheilinus undulatus]|uniref:IgGFc-binding protein-like n=1 Tax=Cheilinus undulatus TaxID=241271 RepID=UPI001BD3BEB6|nr:IgGFc-binding protein-like [Cheilinus undulatus]
MVTLSSSYFGNVGGLCGNYNGDKDDELTTSGGQKARSVVAWAESWSFPDGDPFCFHECKGTCPQCSKEDQEKYLGPKFCGILSKKDGPFASCHATLPVKDFVENCLYDVCLNQGRQEVLCEALGNYMAECQENNASVSSWRLQAGCPTPCPEHSHYKECGSACPASCGPEPEVCPEICVEGCFCDEGYVRSGKDCVKKESCGCSHEGKYYQPGQKFWGDSQCNEKCICDTTTRKVRCTPAGCPVGETCSIKDGVQDCYPNSFKVCTARGDPHFRSFDGHKYDFQGNCLYRLVGMCEENKENKELEQFEVTLENNNRGNSRVSYAKAVTLKFSDKTFTLSQKYYGRVLVDGVIESLPFSWNKDQVQVYRSHRHAVIETHFIRVSYDFMSSVKVELAPHYKNAICGLCGNMNGDPSDDLTLPDGTKAVDANQFGVSQWVADTDGCSHECKDCPPPLPPNFIPPFYTKVCDIITAEDGPLADCSRFLDSKQFHHDCVYDIFLNNGNEGVACDIISNYVEECQSSGGNVKLWRTEKFCPMKCPDFSEYSLTAPGCPVSCNARSPPPRCKIPPAEGCVCKTGYLLSKERCVKLPDCGCTYEGHYLEEGETFQTDRCGSFCKCLNGLVLCIETRCKAKQKCAVVDGVRGCYSKKQLKILKKVEEEEEEDEEEEDEEEEDEMKGSKDKEKGKKKGKKDKKKDKMKGKKKGRKDKKKD